jgi:large subunit ribosomal protein L3
MSETTDQTTSGDAGAAKLDGLYAHKLGMAQVYGENGESIPVTVLKMETWVVSQIKTQENDGYTAVQIASRPKRKVVSNKAQSGHLSKAGFENGAYFVKEIRQEVPVGTAVGQKVSMGSLVKGDVVSITARSKGHGFAGSMKRHNFAGGPASHGSKFHRQPGSGGNRTWPGRVMPGKRYPGHYGNETTTVKSVVIIDVRADEGVLLVKGPVPGGRHTLVRLMKE